MSSVANTSGEPATQLEEDLKSKLTVSGVSESVPEEAAPSSTAQKKKRRRKPKTNGSATNGETQGRNVDLIGIIL